MVCLQTKNSNLGKFWRALEWENAAVIYGHLEYLMAIWNTLWPFGVLYGPLVYLIVIWYIFPSITKKNLATHVSIVNPGGME
jgi:hypothetical protein